MGTSLRRKNRLDQGKSIQDYVVAPSQLWLDGIATHDGKVRQFVAVGSGTGYSIEAQLTGADTTTVLQFEICTMCNYALNIFVRTLGGKTINVREFPSRGIVRSLKLCIQKSEGILANDQRLIFASRQMDSGMSVQDGRKGTC